MSAKKIWHNYRHFKYKFLGTNFQAQISRKVGFPQPILFIFFSFYSLLSNASCISDIQVCMFHKSYYILIVKLIHIVKYIHDIILPIFKEWRQVNNTPLPGQNKVRPPTHPPGPWWPPPHPTGITALWKQRKRS